MQNPFHDKEIWFLTGSQDLYGQETLDQVADQSQKVVALLNESDSIPVPVVWKPVLQDSESIFAALTEAGKQPEVIGVIAWMHTFSPARMWIRGLNALTKPLLHFHTQFNENIPWNTIDMDFMNLNQSAHGDREFGYILTRMDIPRVTVVGHASDKAVTERIGVWARAATGWWEAQNMRVVRFGDNMRDVAVTEGDKTEATIQFGAEINTWSVNELSEIISQVSQSDVDDLIQEYQHTYDIDPILLNERKESLEYAAKQELGMRTFLTGLNASAFTDNFQDLGALKQLPGLPVQRLMAEGYGFGAEGDWKTAILIRVAKVMGYGLTGGASLMEDYCYNFGAGGKKILGAHMLEICPSLTTAKPRMEIHPLGIGDREDPVRLVFNADPGEAVVVAIAHLRDRFRLTANVIDVIEPDHALPNLPVARALWEPRPDFDTSTCCWLAAGAAHHTAMSTAITLDHWEDFARIAGVELAVIDEDTTVRNFEESLRWNSVYHRLHHRY
ncbi:L-arabinose isomerase [Corynebacterium sp. 3HC-13]|uniref:L-arabinose isomerase n=1 Tax=Corynebacterium poyangense TaxID=2684405 RepID=UPI001CC94592|nr:L-arabinose isomerase [Corynebacterium poyangense]MBZ8178314.1 L-arabinose isomerase [Corynebacterium poyangense]